jgi:hypothetical protein
VSVTAYSSPVAHEGVIGQLLFRERYFFDFDALEPVCDISAEFIGSFFG